MMISFIISHSPVFGVLLIIVFIIAAIIDGFRKLVENWMLITRNTGNKRRKCVIKKRKKMK